ncbi:Phospholipase/Carboxylesterase [Aspergillus sclerotialis]|uniref:Phospholipase/Carboxylesterase n=1 Tax=Aspergillus sclerotialis TaxID=2070753 RepID=A0A3A2ZEC4_9EURO|nr:Phospholipase/Carboxylesterase [Aspergillus sclerotialis]
MEFPEPYIYSSQSAQPHTHTVILLHGRGSNGPEFAEEFFAGRTSTDQSLTSCLPTWRWVFPTARERWSRQFQEELFAWFDDGPRHAGDEEEQRIDGLGQSAAYILGILKREIDLLGGNSSRVFLGGISQGMATVLWSVFIAASRERIREQCFGGVLGFCGWLPLGREVEELFRRNNASSKTPKEKQRLICDFALNTITGAAIVPEIEKPIELSWLHLCF